VILREILVIAVIPALLIIGIVVLGTIRAVNNAPENRKKLAALPPVLLVASVIPWLGFDFVYRAAELTMEDSLAILLLVDTALLSFGSFLLAGCIGLFLAIRYRRPRISSSSGT
jgi:hypothetical protein